MKKSKKKFENSNCEKGKNRKHQITKNINNNNKNFNNLENIIINLNESEIEEFKNEKFDKNE
jgi:hypothetical protein